MSTSLTTVELEAAASLVMTACTGLLTASCWDTGEENSRHWSATDPGHTADFKSGNGHLDHIEML